MTDIYGWFLVNYDEVFGTIVALFYLYFSIKQKIWLWPLGFISSAIYSFVFFRSKVYAAMGLQIYYVVISIYGWYIWYRRSSNSETSAQVKSILQNSYLALRLLLISFLLFVFLSQILIHYTDSNIPYFDAFITSLSIVATWMLATKYLEHWFVWIIADSLSVGVFFYKNLYFTVFLYFVYTVMAIIGYKEWKKNLVT